MQLELWVTNDEPSGQDRILQVDRPYPCVPRRRDIMHLGGGSGVSGQVEKVIFDPEGRVTLQFTGSRLQVPPGQSWDELLDSHFEKINSRPEQVRWGIRGADGRVTALPSAILLKEGGDIGVGVPATEVLEGVEQETRSHRLARPTEEPSDG
jgi:hypothetical protein